MTPPAPLVLIDDHWHRLLDEAKGHKLLGLVVHAVATGALAADVQQRAETAEIECELTRTVMWHEQKLVSYAALLHDAGIDSRVLKGPALARLDYPDSIMRPTGDIDLLIRGEQMLDAIELLVDAGGRRVDIDPISGWAATVGKGATVAMPDGFELDLHRIITWGPFGLRIPSEDLWREFRDVEILGTPLRTLPIEESLIHAAYHLQIDSTRRGLTLRDVAQLQASPHLDGGRLERLARRWRAEAPLATALALANQELGVPLAPEIGAWVQTLGLSPYDRLLLRMERPDDQIGFLEPLLVYRALTSSQDRKIFRQATLNPLPGSWPGPRERARRATRRVRASVQRRICS